MSRWPKVQRVCVVCNQAFLVNEKTVKAGRGSTCRHCLVVAVVKIAAAARTEYARQRRAAREQAAGPTPVPVPLTIGGHSAVVPLTKGKFAIIDAADWPLVAPYRWLAIGPNPRGVWYAKMARMPCTYLHRFLTKPGHRRLLVDHWNHDGLNNRRCNLRVCTQTQNQGNRRSFGNSSGYKGVCWDKAGGRWIATIRVQKKRLALGGFDDKEEAARVYDTAARAHFGEFALTNFPLQETA